MRFRRFFAAVIIVVTTSTVVGCGLLQKKDDKSQPDYGNPNLDPSYSNSSSSCNEPSVSDTKNLAPFRSGDSSPASASLALAPKVNYGSIVGNGGFVVTCTDPSGTVTHRLLDFHEAETIRQLTIVVPDAAMSDKQIVAEYIAKIQAFDAALASHLKENITLFESRAVYLDDSYDFPQTMDAGSVIIPSACQLEQVAFQPSGVLGSDAPFIVKKSLWDILPQPERAGLMLHEAIYREAAKLGQETSENTRNLVGIVASEAWNAMDASAYAEMIRRLGFEGVKQMGPLYVVIGSDHYDEETNRMVEAILGRDFKVSETLAFLKDSKLLFHANGTIKEGVVKAGSKLACWYTNIEKDTHFTFDQEGNLVLENGEAVH